LFPNKKRRHLIIKSAHFLSIHVINPNSLLLLFFSRRGVATKKKRLMEAKPSVVDNFKGLVRSSEDFLKSTLKKSLDDNGLNHSQTPVILYMKYILFFSFFFTYFRSFFILACNNYMKNIL
jgi:hypothetical protein